MSKDIKYIELLAKALTSPTGIKVTTPDPERLRQKLYRVRSRHAEYATLVLRPLSSNELAIIPQEPTDAA